MLPSRRLLVADGPKSSLPRALFRMTAAASSGPALRMKRHLVIFARAPQRGRVKSRLAEGIGGGAALQFYRRTLATVLRRGGGARGPARVVPPVPCHPPRSAARRAL